MLKKLALMSLFLTLLSSMAVAQKDTKDLQDAVNDALNFVDWKPGDDFYPKENAKMALEKGDACLAKIDAALGGGLAGESMVETNKESMSVTAARAMCLSVRDKGKKFFGELTAEEEAQYEPFRKVLTGDKLALYNDRLKSYKLYGIGGKVLKTPADYAASTLWCDSGVDRNGIVPMWEVACWHFKGMAKAGDVVTRSGSGESAPSSAYH